MTIKKTYMYIAQTNRTRQINDVDVYKYIYIIIGMRLINSYYIYFRCHAYNITVIVTGSNVTVSSKGNSVQVQSDPLLSAARQIVQYTYSLIHLVSCEIDGIPAGNTAFQNNLSDLLIDGR